MGSVKRLNGDGQCLSRNIARRMCAFFDGNRARMLEIERFAFGKHRDELRRFDQFDLCPRLAYLFSFGHAMVRRSLHAVDRWIGRTGGNDFRFRFGVSSSNTTDGVERDS